MCVGPSALNTSLDVETTRRMVATIRGRVFVVRGAGLSAGPVGALHCDLQQRFVALRVPVDGRRRDHYQHVGGGGRWTGGAVIVFGVRLRLRRWRRRRWRRRRRRQRRQRRQRFVVGGGSGDGGPAGLRNSGATLGRAGDRVQRHDGVPEAGLQVPGQAVPAPLSARVTAQRLPERAPVLHRHHVVQYRVDGGREIVEAPGDRVQQFVGLRVVRRALGVQVEQPLRVERRPAQEERDDHGRCMDGGGGTGWPGGRV